MKKIKRYFNKTFKQIYGKLLTKLIDSDKSESAILIINGAYSQTFGAYGSGRAMFESMCQFADNSDDFRILLAGAAYASTDKNDLDKFHEMSGYQYRIPTKKDGDHLKVVGIDPNEVNSLSSEELDEYINNLLNGES